MTGRAFRASLFVLALASCAPPDPEPTTGTQSDAESVLAVTNARIYPVSGPPIDGGTLLVRAGKILEVGSSVVVPDGAGVLDAKGRSVIPGLVESHSHMGFKWLNIPAMGRNNNEFRSPINAEVRAIDGLTSHEPAFALSLAAGVTTANITTGSRVPNSGQAAVLKLRGGSIEDMYFAEGGMKFAIRVADERPGFPRTIEAVKDLLASELRSARAYLDAQAAAASSGAAPPARDLRLEALGKLLEKKMVLGVHAQSADEMRHAIALKKEFDLDLFIHHATRTVDLVDELIAANIPVSFGPILPFVNEDDPVLQGPIRLIERGGRASFHQDHPDGHQYFLRHDAALFVRNGMPEEEALRALTVYPAALFHLEDRIGTLEPGKDADFIILDGPPLDYESLVTHTFVDGRLVFDRARGFNVFGQRIPEGW
jgi:imidazolonepropionase-like amidohydrolase